jgi:nicotinate phosphoribosyltransferase
MSQTLTEFIFSAGHNVYQPIILEDLDFYKVTMGQVYDAELATTAMEMKFHNRTAGVDLAKYANPLQHHLNLLCSRNFNPETIKRLRELPYMHQGYLDFIEILRLNPNHIKVTTDGTDLVVRSSGPVRLITWFETHVMAMVQELYFRDVHAQLDMTEGMARLDEKIAKYHELSTKYQFTFSEFGTRRRACFAWQEYVVRALVESFGTKSAHFMGTSNVHFATKYKTKFSGTMAHEFLMVGQNLPNVSLDNSQKHMLQLWHKVYRSQLGIALSDVVGTDAFLRDFDRYLASMYDGVRHDSGDPFVWAERHIQNYEKLRIDPMSKVLLFSDGLNKDVVEALLKAFHGKAKLSFGIGTDFTNDLGVKALQLVMKAVRVNDGPVAKISDSPGKGMCEDQTFESYLRYVYKIA